MKMQLIERGKHHTEKMQSEMVALNVESIVK